MEIEWVVVGGKEDRVECLCFDFSCFGENSVFGFVCLFVFNRALVGVLWRVGVRKWRWRRDCRGGISECTRSGVKFCVCLFA